MTKKTLIWVFLVIALLGMYTGKVSARVGTASGELAQQRQDLRFGEIKGKAGEEVDRRLNSLNGLVTRIGGIKKLPESQKALLSTQAQVLSAELTKLKTKIDGDTDLATLQTDRKSIFNSYRVYMLFLPKTHIIAAADRIIEIAEKALGALPLIQAKATPAQADILKDLEAKLNDAKVQAQNALNLVNPLEPDKGDPAQVQSNNVAIKSAREMIKSAIADLKAARTDLKNIRSGWSVPNE